MPFTTNTALLMAAAAGVANAGVAAASKAAERSRCRLAPYGLVALGVASLTACAPALSGPSDWRDWRLWAFGGVMGALYLAAIASMLRANRLWPPSVVWSAANMAFVLPILLSALCLREPLRWLDAAIATGFVLMLLELTREAAAAGNQPDAATSPTPATAARWLLLSVVFATNGLLMFGFKLFGVWLPGQRAPCLVAVMYGSGAALALGALLARRSFSVTRTEAGWGLATGTAVGLAALALLPAMQLPAAVAFPVIQGLSLAGGVLLCAWLFCERLTPRKLLALAAGLAAMALAGLR